jgi:5,5'-dehydrodivanillate O-demethylase
MTCFKIYPLQARIPYWHGPIADPTTGRWITSHVMNQDFVAWMGQGVIADRTKEHLGKSDAGVLMMRKRFLADIERVESGNDPSGLARDPSINRCIELRVIGLEGYRNGLSRAELQARNARLGHPFPMPYIFQAGQPDAVRREYEAAMGG